jgi:hypothetical protein
VRRVSAAAATALPRGREGITVDCRPGLDSRRLLRLMQAAIARCHLNLTGLTVVTEAATGAYVVTPVLAALAGATHVHALTRATRHGSVDDVRAETMALARLAGVEERIELATVKTAGIIAAADIVTNSGHVRPIDAATVASMRSGAVVALMYEAWELRPGDLDLDACARAGVPVAGTCERHTNIDVFSFLGPMAVKQLHDAGVAVHGSSILLVCDNPFAPFVERGLRSSGAHVETVAELDAAQAASVDAIVVALTPAAGPRLTVLDAAVIARRWPGAVVAQFWGDLDRDAFADASVPVWPRQAPGPGHMGILPSDIGPEPIVRLQAGGLKAAEVLWRQQAREPHVDLSYVERVKDLRTVCLESC